MATLNLGILQYSAGRRRRQQHSVTRTVSNALFILLPAAVRKVFRKVFACCVWVLTVQCRGLVSCLSMCVFLLLLWLAAVCQTLACLIVQWNVFYVPYEDLRFSPQLLFNHLSWFLLLYPLLVFPLLHIFPHHCIPPSPDAKHRAESELGPQTRPRSNTLPKSFGSTLDQGAYDAAVEVKGQRPTREETLDLIQRRVKGKRQEDGWPDDIKVSCRCFYRDWISTPVKGPAHSHSCFQLLLFSAHWCMHRDWGRSQLCNITSIHAICTRF